MSIQLNAINCFYGAHQALFDINLACPQGETLVLLGPSGAGKSSLLRVLNLLELPRSGSLQIAGNHFDFSQTPSDNAIRELRRIKTPTTRTRCAKPARTKTRCQIGFKCFHFIPKKS